MKRYRVLQREDNGTVVVVERLIESDQTVPELLQHAHIVEVLEEVTEIKPSSKDEKKSKKEETE